MRVSVFTPYGWPALGPEYLEPTDFLDYNHPEVDNFVRRAIEGKSGLTEKAVALFYAVRDLIRYDPYSARLTPECYRASTVVKEQHAFCIPKAVLLAAGARSIGIPAAIGLSDVVNHFSSPKMQKMMDGRNIFMHHGWAALHLDGRWVKAVPAFNKTLCEQMRVPPTEFDGIEDATLQQYSEDGSLQMEYLKDHGIWSDLPFQRIDADWSGYYPPAVWNGHRSHFNI